MNVSQNRAKSIFLSAAEIASFDERRAFVTAECEGDEALRAEVDELLRHEQLLGGFLESPAVVFDADPAKEYGDLVGEQPGMIIGAYKLLQQIGEGGFGVVFLAEQERPVKRRVALKVIRPGMDTREVIGRFEAERQALAMMDHPNIAKVFDAGATETGRPYFVMELVQGVPITEYCDQCNLPTRERLELFVTVCQAVQHAHQKGIIHRDLKPTNVLVAMQDGKATPKIIDFGVAKAIGERLTERTLTTAFAQMVGTPLYMSPEQAELSPLGVDTRSDIYSLGVMLYELLTGATPFDKDRLHAAPYDELRRIIREEEPPRPSARISTLAADLATTISERRRTDARRLQQTVRGELDWIVMKCLEKDRNRRYETPNNLARDIERYLHGETVQACPPSTSYRFRKFALRNKALLAAGGAIAAALVIGLGLSTWMYIRERAAVQTAKANEALATTESARAKTVSDLLQEMLGSADAGRAKGSQYTVRELLDEFSAGLGDQLADEPSVEADVRATIGRAYRSLGVPEKAKPNFERAIELRQRVDGPQHENVAAILVDYAWTLENEMRFDEAEAQLHEALNIYRRRGITGAPVIHALAILQESLIHSSETTGRDDEAERVTQEALAVARSSGKEFPELATMLHRFASMRRNQARLGEAEALARQAVDMLRRVHSGPHPETAYGLRTLANVLQEQQKFEEAESVFQECLAVFRRCYPEDHPDVRLTVDWLTELLEARGDKSAMDEFESEEAGSDAPSEHLRLAGLLLTTNQMGGAIKVEARRLIQRAIDEYGQVALDSPGNISIRLEAAKGYQKVATFSAANPDLAGELDQVQRRVAAELEELRATFPNSAECQVRVSQLYAASAYFSGTHERQEEAAEFLRRAALAVERVRDPAHSLNALYFLAMARMRLGDEAGYRQLCAAMLPIPASRDNDSLGMRRAWIWCLGPHPNEDLSEALNNAEEFVAHNSLRAPYYDHNLLGGVLYRAGQYERAAHHLKESIATYPSNPPPGYGTVLQPRLFLAMTQWQLGQRDEARRLLAETEPAIDEWLQSPSHFWSRRAAPRSASPRGGSPNRKRSRWRTPDQGEPDAHRTFDN